MGRAASLPGTGRGDREAVGGDACRRTRYVSARRHLYLLFVSPGSRVGKATARCRFAHPTPVPSRATACYANCRRGRGKGRTQTSRNASRPKIHGRSRETDSPARPRAGPPRADLRFRQGRARRFRRGARRRGVELISTGGIGQGDRRKRHAGRPMSSASPASPKSWTAASRRCTRRPWRHSRRPRRSRARRGDGASMGSPAIDLAGRQSLSVRGGPPSGADYADDRREHRHRRAGNDPRRGQEPRLCRRRRPIPPTTPRSSTRWTMNSGAVARVRGSSWRPRRSPAPPPMTPPSRTGSPRRSAIEHAGRRAFGGRLDQRMRYGENPHQAAGFYVDGEPRPGVATARQMQGKELSYNNINDTDAAFELVAEFDPAARAAVAIIKHANPCGVAVGPTLADGLRQGAGLRSGLAPSAASSRSTGRSTPRRPRRSSRCSPR